MLRRCLLRREGYSLLSSLSKLSSSRDIAEDIKHGRSQNNRAIVRSMEEIKTFEEIEYRKHDRPWELVPKYAKRRVTDLVGILTSEHRMEVEQTIEKMLPICDVDLYVVIVPTVGYMDVGKFGNSIFFDWGIGEPRGNGILLLITQREAEIHLISGCGIEEYFGQQFVDPLMEEIFQPLIKAGKPSKAIVETTYAVARHAQECRHLWQGGLMPMPVRNKVRFGMKTTVYGMRALPWYSFGSLMFMALAIFFYNQLLDAKCPCCGAWMARARSDEAMKAAMDPGEFIEYKNGCTQYRVWRCMSCKEGKNVQVVSRDLHQNDKCLKCVDCEFYTCKLSKTIEKLPSREEDGVKRLLYECENCRIGRDIALPLYRPLDKNPEVEWYDFLLDRAKQPQAKDGMMVGQKR